MKIKLSAVILILLSLFISSCGKGNNGISSNTDPRLMRKRELIMEAIWDYEYRNDEHAMLDEFLKDVKYYEECDTLIFIKTSRKPVSKRTSPDDSVRYFHIAYILDPLGLIIANPDSIPCRARLQVPEGHKCEPI